MKKLRPEILGRSFYLRIFFSLASNADVVVIKETPPDSVVVVVREGRKHVPNEKADLEHGSLPDTIGDTLIALIAHVDELEKRVNGGHYGPALHIPERGVWHGSDFAI